MQLRGLGTLINVALIIVGGVIGYFSGNKFPERVRNTLMNAVGVSVIFLAAGGVLSKMLVIENGRLSSSGTIMMIASLAIGGLIGELIDFEGKIIKFGDWLKKKTGNASDGAFTDAFVSASCTVCVGAMAVVGAINDGIDGDYTVLLAKGILDAVIILIMTASMGKGCIFSALPVAVFQGIITAAACFAGSFMTEAALDNLSYVGSVLIFCVGLNLIRERKIAVANLLPAVIVAAVWGFVAA